MATSPGTSAAISNLRPDLNDALTEFDLQRNEMSMIGLDILPPIDVALQSGPFPKIQIESLLRAVVTARNSNGTYAQSDFKFTTDSYATEENGLEVPVDERNKRLYQHLIDSELIAARLSRHGLLLNQELRIAAAVFNTGTFSPTSAAVSWATVASATPLTDVEARVQSLYTAGIIADTLVMSWKTFRDLRNTAQVIDRITASGAGRPAKAEDVTIDMLRAVFALPKILVGAAQYNSAIEGQTPVIAPVWSNGYVAVCRTANGAGATLEDPAIGRTFHWSADGSQIGGTFESYYSNEKRGDVVRNRMETQEKVIYTAANQLIDIAL